MELLIVVSLMGLMLTLAAPRLSAFFAQPEDRELVDLEHFFLKSVRRASRTPLVPDNQPDAKPLRIKIIPPKDILLLQADTELAKFEFTRFKIDAVNQTVSPDDREPEFSFNAIGLLPPFSLKLAGTPARPLDRRLWQLDRLGSIRVDPAS